MGIIDIVSTTHICVTIEDWGKFKNSLRDLFDKKVYLDEFEVIIISSSKYKGKLVGQKIELPWEIK